MGQVTEGTPTEPTHNAPEASRDDDSGRQSKKWLIAMLLLGFGIAYLLHWWQPA